MAKERPSESIESLKVLSHPTRFAVIETLLEAQSGSLERVSLRFSQLQDRIEIEDSSNLNYHLNQLKENYVIQTETGYSLTQRGYHIGIALISEPFTQTGSEFPDKELGKCLLCGEPMNLRPRQGVLELVCQNEHTAQIPAAPRVVEHRSVEELKRIVAKIIYQTADFAVNDVCPFCYGRITSEMTMNETHQAYLLDAHCSDCGLFLTLPVGVNVVTHPDVLEFFYERGLDPRETPPWDLQFCEPGMEMLESTEPVRIRIDIEHGEQTLSVTIDENASVRKTCRHR